MDQGRAVVNPQSVICSFFKITGSTCPADSMQHCSLQTPILDINQGEYQFDFSYQNYQFYRTCALINAWKDNVKNNTRHVWTENCFENDNVIKPPERLQRPTAPEDVKYDTRIRVLRSLNSQPLFGSCPGSLAHSRKDVWIHSPLIPSSDVTTRKPGSDFDWLII